MTHTHTHTHTHIDQWILSCIRLSNMSLVMYERVFVLRGLVMEEKHRLSIWVQEHSRVFVCFNWLGVT